MSLLRNIGLMGVTTVARMSFGLLSFVVMAQLLGSAQSGEVTMWLLAATLLVLVANFRFTPNLLRGIGARLASALKVMGNSVPIRSCAR